MIDRKNIIIQINENIIHCCGCIIQIPMMQPRQKITCQESQNSGEEKKNKIQRQKLSKVGTTNKEFTTKVVTHHRCTERVVSKQFNTSQFKRPLEPPD